MTAALCTKKTKRQFRKASEGKRERKTKRGVTNKEGQVSALPTAPVTTTLGFSGVDALF